MLPIKNNLIVQNPIQNQTRSYHSSETPRWTYAKKHALLVKNKDCLHFLGHIEVCLNLFVGDDHLTLYNVIIIRWFDRNNFKLPVLDQLYPVLLCDALLNQLVKVLENSHEFSDEQQVAFKELRDDIGWAHFTRRFLAFEKKESLSDWNKTIAKYLASPHLTKHELAICNDSILIWLSVNEVSLPLSLPTTAKLKWLPEDDFKAIHRYLRVLALSDEDSNRPVKDLFPDLKKEK